MAKSNKEYPKIPFIKTKIGEHDFNKPACFQYCKMGGRFCPFINDDLENIRDHLSSPIKRWTDIAENKISNELTKKNSEDYQISKSIYGPKEKQKECFEEMSHDDGHHEIQQEEEWWGYTAADTQTSYSASFTCWCDGSGFEYDKMSQDVIGRGSTFEYVYDITNYGINHRPLRFSEWNAWIDKIQYDYRFGQVSDQNAQGILFPNIDNPWKFTQYVYRGIGSDDNLCALTIPKEYVVQPPVYDPKTLKLINADFTVEDFEKYADGKYYNLYSNSEKEKKKTEALQHEYEYIKYHTSNVQAKKNIYKRKNVKQFRQIINWSELNSFSKEEIEKYMPASSQSQIEEKYKYLNQNNSQLQANCNDVGIKLYKVSIPVQSVKWGEHGNIPPHSLDMTAPAYWLDPSKSGNTKVEITYDAVVGAPFYCGQIGLVKWNGSQATVYSYTSYSSEIETENDKKYYNYLVSNSGTELQMPTRQRGSNEILLNPTNILMGENIGNQEFAHQGCQFLYGKNRKFRCKMLEASTNQEEIEQLNDSFDFSKCVEKQYSGNCPKHVSKTQLPIIASYQTTVEQVNQVSTPSFGNAGTITDSYIQYNNDYNDYVNNVLNNLNNKKDIQITYVARYVVKDSQDNPVQYNKDKWNQHKQGLQIVPNTGKFAFDKCNNQLNGDTNLENDISALSYHRFFQSVMHCSTNFCNLVSGPSQAKGFDLYSKAGGDEKCKYYNEGLSVNSKIGCPYNCAPKRGIEFAHVASNVSSIIKNFMVNYEQRTRQLGIWDFEWPETPFTPYLEMNKFDIIYTNKSGTLSFPYNHPIYGSINGRSSERLEGYLQWIVYDGWAVTQYTDDIAIIAVKLDTLNKDNSSSSEQEIQQGGSSSSSQNEVTFIPFSPQFGGASLFRNDPKDSAIPQGYYVFCELKTERHEEIITLPKDYDSTTWRKNYSSSSSYQNNSIEENLKEVKMRWYKPIQGYYWYQPLDNDGGLLSDGIKHPYFDSTIQPFKSGEEEGGEGESSSSSTQGRIDYGKREKDEETGKMKWGQEGWHTPVNLRQHVDKRGLWFCRMQDNVVIPKTNCIIVDNEQKFVGGYHPEYKDYSKRGSQFMQQIGVQNDQIDTFQESVGNAVNKKGYWIDESGQYIIDQRQIGYDKDIAGDDQRASTGGAGGSVCISYKMSNTEVDGTTGKTTPAKVINGAVFANDPFDLVCHWFKVPDAKLGEDGKKTGFHPMIPDPQKDNQKYHAPCFVKTMGLLPTCRPAVYCPVCDYYLPFKYENLKTCPWCGMDYAIVKGSDGSELVDSDDKETVIGAIVGHSWEELWGNQLETIKNDNLGGGIKDIWSDESSSSSSEYSSSDEFQDELNASPSFRPGVNETPITAYDGTTGSDKLYHESISYEIPPVIKKFFKIKSIGNADVWAPPGSAIKTDAYFWRHLTHINNGLKRQIVHKLGTPNTNESGGGYQEDGSGYQFNNMTASSQLTLGYPEWIGKYMKIDPNKILAKMGDKYIYEDYRWGTNVIQYSEKGKSPSSWKDKGSPVVTNYAIGAYNPTMPRHMLPQLYGKSDEGQEDEGVIAPYSILKKEKQKDIRYIQDALKMISFDEITLLRNSIQPILAYTSQSYGGEYPTMRASYKLRESIDQQIIYQGKRCVVDPIILACTAGGGDSYLDYFSGDYTSGEGGIVREYYPSGYTWWNQHQLMGGRYTKQKGGRFHMDDPDIGYIETGSGGLYTTGERTVAFCAMFIHGIVPLDKQILAAYVIIQPSGTDPSKGPVGYPWNAGMSARIMYHHYHAMVGARNPLTWLSTDFSASFLNEKGKPHFGDGIAPHLHGSAGYKNHYWNEIGYDIMSGDFYAKYSSDDINYQDESAYTYYGQEGHSVIDDRNVFYEDNFKQMIGSLAGAYDKAFYRNAGISKVNVYSKESDDLFLDNNNVDTSNLTKIGEGYDSYCFPKDTGFQFYNTKNTKDRKNKKYQYVVLNDDKDIVVKYNKDQTWKTGETKIIEEQIKDNTYDIQFTVSDGTKDNVDKYVFTQVGANVYQEVVADQSQGITGYFDMKWTNTMGYSYGKYEVDYGESYTEWNAPVIFQDSSTPYINYSGGNNENSGNTSQVARCFDVTDKFRSLYNDRIARQFTCHGGSEYKDIKKKFYKTINKGALDDDVGEQNIQDSYDGEQNIQDSYDGSSGYVLNCCQAYPKLGKNSLTPPVVPQDGTKYQLDSEEYIEFYVSAPSYPFTLEQDNKYLITQSYLSDENLVGSELSISTVEDYDDYKELIKEIFTLTGEESGKNIFQISKVTSSTIKIKAKQSFYLYNVENSCYGKVGLSPFVGYNGVYAGSQRITSVSAYNNNYHPANLLSDNGDWEYDSYQDDDQYFVVDLLRAPLCIYERNWRDKQAHQDYGNARCPSQTCSAHTQGCSVAANMKGKYFDKSSPYCPVCGQSLVGAPGVVSIPGDGIKTYKYDKPFSSDAFITKIVLGTTSDDNKYIAPIEVSYKMNGDDSWRPIISLDVVNSNYKSKLSSFLVSSFSSDKDGSIIYINGEPPKLRARFIKIKCKSNEYNNFQIFKIVQNRGYQIIVEMINGKSFNDLGRFSFAGYQACISENNGQILSYDSWKNRTVNKTTNTSSYGYEVKIVSAQILSSSDGKYLKISLNRFYSGNNKYIKFFSKKYAGGLGKLKIYGWHYKTQSNGGDSNQASKEGELNDDYLIMNGSYDVVQMNISTTKSNYKLSSPPTEIIQVAVGRGDSPSIVLQQTSDLNNVLWDTESITLSDGKTKYNKVTGGSYYYNNDTGIITIPIKSADKYASQFQIELINAGIAKSYLPTRLFVYYWGGNGKEITLKATANGNGPSYMLQKNAINKIVNSQFKDGYTPYNEKFCISNEKTFPWICYNNVPAGLSIQYASKSSKSQNQNYNQQTNGVNISDRKSGTFHFSGITYTQDNQLNVFDEKETPVKIADQFEPHCENLFGICETQVTFVGKPDTIFSGDIIVQAPDITTHKLPSDKTYAQRTGGINKGIMIISIAPSESSQADRVTKCYLKPKLVVFAREAKRYFDGDIEDKYKITF